MGVHDKQVKVCEELDAVLSILVTLVDDIKKGQSASQVVMDVMPKFVSALSNLSQLSLEVSVENAQAVDNTFALKAVELKQILIPGVI